MIARLLTALATLALVAIAPATAHAGTPTGDGIEGFALTPVGDFETPIDADNAPGFPAALFVAEKGGRILVVKNGVTRTALDLTAMVEDGGEQGLLSIAFHPRYRRNRLLYGDASSDQIRSLIPAEAGAFDVGYTGISLPSGTPYSFAEGAGRRLYVVSGAGPVYRLDPA